MNVRPWKPPENATTAERPVAARAIFTAFSTASAPVVTKIGLLLEFAGDRIVEPLGERRVALVGHDLVAGMGEAVELRLDRFNDLRVPMAGIDHRDARREIDISVALDIPDLGIFGMVDVDLRDDSNTTGNGIGPSSFEARVIFRH